MLVELAEGKTPMVDAQAPEEEVMSWPHTVFRMLVVFVGVVAVLSAVAYFFDAPLEELANPDHPANPAKAPWYFLGLQEIVSYSALAGGVIVPAAAIIGLMTIPYVDRNPRDRRVVHLGPGPADYALVGRGGHPGRLVLTYLNEHYAVRILVPGASQIWVDLLNPGPY